MEQLPELPPNHSWELTVEDLLGRLLGARVAGFQSEWQNTPVTTLFMKLHARIVAAFTGIIVCQESCAVFGFTIGVANRRLSVPNQRSVVLQLIFARPVFIARLMPI